jgi:hypothetical protein
VFGGIFQVLQYKYIVVSAAQLIVDSVASELPASFQPPTKWPDTQPFVAFMPYEHKALCRRSPVWTERRIESKRSSGL